MCTYGGSRYGNTGCRRTYLSQRDLQAHINHRHIIPDGKGDGGKPIAQRKGSISNDSMVQSPFGQTVSSPLNLSQTSIGAHNLSAIAPSTSYYSSYGSMQTHGSHYSSASRNVNSETTGSHKPYMDRR